MHSIRRRGPRSPQTCRIGPAPAFVNENSSVSLSYRVTGVRYPIHVEETRGGRTRELRHDETYGRRVALYVGRRSDPGQETREGVEP